MEKIIHMKEVEKVLARGKSLFTFRGVMKLYLGMDLDETKSHIFNNDDQYWAYWEHNVISEFCLVMYRRHQVLFRFPDEAITFEMNEKTGEFKLISCEHEGLINMSMSQLRDVVNGLGPKIKEGLLGALRDGNGVE